MLSPIRTTLILKNFIVKNVASIWMNTLFNFLNPHKAINNNAAEISNLEKKEKMFNLMKTTRNEFGI